MPTCKGTLSNGKPCPKTVDEGKPFCRWHDSKDESWREIYKLLTKAKTSEQKTHILLGLIKEHPEHELVLPDRDGQRVDLSHIDLSRETLDKIREKFLSSESSWWFTGLPNAEHDGANLRYADLRHANLAGANLKRANLTQANLSKTNLIGANLQEAGLWTAYLKGATVMFANLQGAQLSDANLQGANLMSVNLQGANLRNSNLQGADLHGADLRGAELWDANFHDAILIEAKLQGVDLSKVKGLSNVYLFGVWLDRTRIYREQFGSAIREERERIYARAKLVYLALKQNFDDLGDYDDSSWAYRKERRMEKLEAREMGRAALKERKWGGSTAHYFKFFSDTVVEWLCDYGESVWKVIGWMAVLLFIVGPILLSSLGGIAWTKELTHEYFELSSWDRFWLWYRTYLLYTLDTLTTANFSGLQPINDAVKLASGFFAIAGIVLAGLLGFVAGNRIRRS